MIISAFLILTDEKILQSFNMVLRKLHIIVVNTYKQQESEPRPNLGDFSEFRLSSSSAIYLENNHTGSSSKATMQTGRLALKIYNLLLRYAAAELLPL